VGESAVGSPTLDSGSEQSSRAVRAALLQERQNAAPGPDTAKLAGGPKAEATPTQNLGEASATNTAQRNGDAALANGEGSGAGHNAAVVRETDAAALNAALRSRFRDITLGAQHNTRQEASGSGVALAALSLTAQTAEFDQVQAALAARAAAAQVNQPAASGSSGPGGALLQRRYLQLRNTTP
jgi:hypothetical protein